jgi:hypothetical protein
MAAAERSTEMAFRYVERPLSKKQQKAAAKNDANQKKEAEQEAEKVKAAELQKVMEQRKAQARFVAKANYKPTLPVNTKDYVVQLIMKTDFSTADYVETSPDGTLRRALKHHVEKDNQDKDSDRYVGDTDCWIGGNAHFVSGFWIPGHSYMLGFKNLQIDTTNDAVRAIADLPAAKGARPDIL